ncbi:MAG: hypothetical protein J5I93_28550 [Pirellulaceae bacterium]|nr:hypothetical protein [Pirellulaceae bacterium]
MALTFTHNDKFSPSDTISAFAVVAAMNLDFSAQTGRIVYNIFKSQEAFMAGGQIYDQVALVLTKDALSAEDAQGNPLSKQEDGSYQDSEGNTVLPAKLELPAFVDLVRERMIDGDDTGKTVFQIVAEILYTKGIHRGLFQDPVDAGLPY